MPSLLGGREDPLRIRNKSREDFFEILISHSTFSKQHGRRRLDRRLMDLEQRYSEDIGLASPPTSVGYIRFRPRLVRFFLVNPLGVQPAFEKLDICFRAPKTHRIEIRFDRGAGYTDQRFYLRRSPRARKSLRIPATDSQSVSVQDGLVKWRTHDEAGHRVSRFVMGPDIPLQRGQVEGTCRATFDRVIHFIERSIRTLRERTATRGAESGALALDQGVLADERPIRAADFISRAMDGAPSERSTSLGVRPLKSLAGAIAQISVLAGSDRSGSISAVISPS